MTHVCTGYNGKRQEGSQSNPGTTWAGRFPGGDCLMKTSRSG